MAGRVVVAESMTQTFLIQIFEKGLLGELIILANGCLPLMPMLSLPHIWRLRQQDTPCIEL